GKKILKKGFCKKVLSQNKDVMY
mgnify:CR=1